jgi:hypothetical protein
MKFLLLVFAVCLHTSYSMAQTDIDFPELSFGIYKDRALAALSFRSNFPDHIKLIGPDGDSSVNYTIVSGMIELLGTGEKEQIRTGGYLSDEAIFMIANAKPGIIKISAYCKSSDMLSSFETNCFLALGIHPVIVMADIFNGDSTVAQSRLEPITEIKIGYPDYPGMEDFFKISGGSIALEAEMEEGKILKGGTLDAHALQLLRNATGRRLTITVMWTDSSGAGRLYNYDFMVVEDE